MRTSRKTRGAYLSTHNSLDTSCYAPFANDVNAANDGVIFYEFTFYSNLLLPQALRFSVINEFSSLSILFNNYYVVCFCYYDDNNHDGDDLHSVFDDFSHVAS